MVWDPYADFKSAVLPNGLTVYALHWPDRPWEAVSFLVHSGAERDLPGEEGASHFVEHLVSECASISHTALQSFFDDTGGGVNLGGTSYAATRYSFTVPIEVDVLEKSFQYFGEMLFDAQLGNNLERERKVIEGEFHRQYPHPLAYDFAKKQHAAIHKGTRLERHIVPLGTLESIQGITQTQLQRHYDTHYTPKNVSVVCVGGLSLEDVAKQLSAGSCSILKAGSRSPSFLKVSECKPLEDTRYHYEISKYVTTEKQRSVGGYESYARVPGTMSTSVLIVPGTRA